MKEQVGFSGTDSEFSLMDGSAAGMPSFRNYTAMGLLCTLCVYVYLSPWSSFYLCFWRALSKSFTITSLPPLVKDHLLLSLPQALWGYYEDYKQLFNLSLKPYPKVTENRKSGGNYSKDPTFQSVYVFSDETMKLNSHRDCLSLAHGLFSASPTSRTDRGLKRSPVSKGSIKKGNTCVAPGRAMSVVVKNMDSGLKQTSCSTHSSCVTLGMSLILSEPQ